MDCRTAHQKYGEFLFSGGPLFIASTNIYIYIILYNGFSGASRCIVQSSVV